MLAHIEHDGFSLKNIAEPVGRYNEDDEQPYFRHMAKLFDIAGVAGIPGAGVCRL